MDIQQLLSTDSAKVRRNPDLFAFYIATFKKEMGYAPNCSSCSFNEDFRKLKAKFSLPDDKNFVNLNFNSNYTSMKTFQLKSVRNIILSYSKEGQTFRKYDNKMTDDFAVNFLTFGTEDQIKDRIKLFKKLPDGYGVISEKTEEGYEATLTAEDIKQHPELSELKEGDKVVFVDQTEELEKKQEKEEEEELNFDEPEPSKEKKTRAKKVDKK